MVHADGTAPHILSAFWEFLKKMFPEEWIGNVNQQHCLFLTGISFPYCVVSGASKVYFYRGVKIIRLKWVFCE
jgi:hypothetical protein